MNVAMKIGIVGAGILGLMTARQFLRADCKNQVVLFERAPDVEHLLGGTSWGDTRTIRPAENRDGVGENVADWHQTIVELALAPRYWRAVPVLRYLSVRAGGTRMEPGILVDTVGLLAALLTELEDTNRFSARWGSEVAKIDADQRLISVAGHMQHHGPFRQIVIAAGSGSRDFAPSDAGEPTVVSQPCAHLRSSLPYGTPHAFAPFNSDESFGTVWGTPATAQRRAKISASIFATTACIRHARQRQRERESHLRAMLWRVLPRFEIGQIDHWSYPTYMETVTHQHEIEIARWSRGCVAVLSDGGGAFKVAPSVSRYIFNSTTQTGNGS